MYADGAGVSAGASIPDRYRSEKNMGQYYLIVNKTKKQFLYPHVFDDGLKAWEIVAGGHTLKALGYLLVKSDGGGGGDLKENDLVGYWAGDEIVITGDYDSSKLYDEAQESYTDISTTVLAAMVKDEGIYEPEEITAMKEKSWMKEYRREHKPIPFSKLSTEGRAKVNPGSEPGSVKHLLPEDGKKRVLDIL